MSAYRHPGYDSPAGPPMTAETRARLDAFDDLLDSMTAAEFAEWLERRAQRRTP